MDTKTLYRSDEYILSKVFEKISSNNNKQKTKILIRLHKITLIGAVAILVKEIFTKGQISEYLRLTQYDPSMSYPMAIAIIFLLSLFIGATYLILKSHAQDQELVTRDYVERFKILKWSHLLSELIIMFLFVFTVMYFQKGILVAPLLGFFIGNFLLQGHLFQLSTKQSIGFALIIYAIAGYTAYKGYYNLSVPLTLFILLNIYSLFLLKSRSDGRA